MKNSSKTLIAILILVLIGGTAYYFADGNYFQGLTRLPSQQKTLTTQNTTRPIEGKIAFTITQTEQKDTSSTGYTTFAIKFTTDGSKFDALTYNKYVATLYKDSINESTKKTVNLDYFTPSSGAYAQSALPLIVPPNTKATYHLVIFAVDDSGKTIPKSTSDIHNLCVDTNSQPIITEKTTC
jgi:hypothetical protein